MGFGKNLLISVLMLASVSEASVSNFTFGMIRAVLQTQESIAARMSVAIANTKQERIHCSGVVIGKRTILTSAHCVENFLPQELRLDFSTIATYASAKTLVHSVIVHEGYSTDDEVVNDIALIELSEDVPQQVEIASLFGQSHLSGDFPVESFGYSRYTTDKSTSIFDYLFGRSEDYDTSDMYNERDEYGLHAKILPARFQSKSVIVLEQQLGGICPGDSGGPTFIFWQNKPLLLGLNWSIVDSPAGGNSCSREAAVLPIYPYLEWIKRNASSKVSVEDQIISSKTVGTAHDRQCIENYLRFMRAFSSVYGPGEATLAKARQRVCKERQMLESVIDQQLPTLKATCRSSAYADYLKKSKDLFVQVCDQSLDFE